MMKGDMGIGDEAWSIYACLGQARNDVQCLGIWHLAVVVCSNDSRRFEV